MQNPAYFEYILDDRKYDTSDLAVVRDMIKTVDRLGRQTASGCM